MRKTTNNKEIGGGSIKVGISTQRKLSIAVGLLSCAAFIIQGLSTTWGFKEVGEQIVQTALLFSGAINIYFIGATTQKISEEKKENEKD